MTCWRSIEDDNIKTNTIEFGLVEKIRKTVKGGNFNCARPTHLLFHDSNHRLWEDCPNRSKRPILIFLGCMVSINFHRPEILDRTNGGNAVSNALFKDIA